MRDHVHLWYPLYVLSSSIIHFRYILNSCMELKLCSWMMNPGGASLFYVYRSVKSPQLLQDAEAPYGLNYSVSLAYRPAADRYM